MDSPSAFFDTTSADSTPLKTKKPSFELRQPEDLKQRVNKGFRVSEILGTNTNYRSSILELFTNFAKWELLFCNFSREMSLRFYVLWVRSMLSVISWRCDSSTFPLFRVEHEPVFS